MPNVPSIGVLVVDDHPAVRAGLRALIDAEHDMHAVGEAGDMYDLAPAVRRFGPDVVVLDYQLPGDDGITLCHRIKRSVNAPGVMLYSSFVGPAMAVPARIAGADAVVDKAIAPRELLAIIRRRAAGESLALQITSETLNIAGEQLPAEDLPILGMLVHGSPISDIADALRLTREEVDHRIERILGRLVARRSQQD